MGGGLSSTAGIRPVLVVRWCGDGSTGTTQEEFQSQKPQALVIHAEGEG